MSFDLAVWWEPGPITAQRAQAIYYWLIGEGDDLDSSNFDLRSHDAVAAFEEALIEQFPRIGDVAEEDLDATPWSMDPWFAPDHVLLTIRWAWADELSAVVRNLATEHGLVVWDPQARKVHQIDDLEPGSTRPVLTLCDGSLVDAPTPAEVARAIGTLSKDNWFAILDKGDEVYLQVGVGGGEGVGDLPAGRYNLERRDGAADRHYRHETDNVGTVLRAFQGFAVGHVDWAADVTWERMAF